MYKSIENKVNNQSNELMQRAKMIEDLKTSLAIFIDKYNKTKVELEKERQKNLQLSFGIRSSQRLKSIKKEKTTIDASIGYFKTTHFCHIFFAKRGNNQRLLTETKELKEEIEKLNNESLKKESEYNLSINKIKFELSNAQQRINELENELKNNSEKDSRIQALQNKLSYNKNEINNLTRSNKELGESNSNLRSQVNDLNQLKEDLEKEIADLKYNNKRILSEKKEVDDCIDSLQEKLAKCKSDLAMAYQKNQKDNEELLAQITNLTDKMDKISLEQKEKEAKLRKELERARGISSFNELVAMKVNFIIVKGNNKTQILERKVNMLNDELISVNKNNKELNDDNLSLIQKNKELNADMSELKKKINTLNDQLLEANKKIKEFSQDGKSISEEAILKSKIEELQNMLNDANLKIKELNDNSIKKENEEKEKLIQKIEEQKTEIANLNNSIKSINEDLLKKDAKIKELNEEIKLKTQKINDLNSKNTANNNTNNAELEAANKKIKELSDQLLASNKKNFEYKEQLSDSNKKNKTINDELLEANKKNKDLNDQIQKLKTSLKDNKKNYKDNFNSFKEKLEKMYQNMNIFMIEIENKLNDNINKIQNKLKTIKSKIEKTNRVSGKNNQNLLQAYQDLETENSKLNVKLANCENIIKQKDKKIDTLENSMIKLKNEIDSLNTQLSDIERNNKYVDILKKQNKDLQDKVEMYIVENKGKSKIIEERNEEIKNLKKMIDK